jgi:hypothetical protein
MALFDRHRVGEFDLVFGQFAHWILCRHVQAVQALPLRLDCEKPL